jgi:hypothetical protein
VGRRDAAQAVTRHAPSHRVALVGALAAPIGVEISAQFKLIDFASFLRDSLAKSS